MSTSAIPPAIELLGGYEVLAELDTGGMGEVFIARKRAVGGFERLVALKTVRTEIAHVDAARDMFLDEGRLLARLHHRGIAQVYDFGEDGDRLFLAMEYVAGVDFDDLIANRVEPGVACLAMAEAARALHAAHEVTDADGVPLGVVHRDVSPGNLMLTFDGSVKVLDFGIALMRGRRAPVTEFGMLKGKPPYMAPEQVRSEAVDPRTDVFSACAVLWELLTGERLFTGDSIFAIGRAIESGEVEPPSSLRAGIDAELDAVVLRGLDKDPRMRFQSAGELAASLEAIARRLGAEALSDYARRELAEERVAHLAHVAELSRQSPDTKPRLGRETHSHTIPALEIADTAPGDEEQQRAREPGETDVSEPASRSRWLLVLSLFAAVALLGVIGWQLGVASRSVATDASDAGFGGPAVPDSQATPAIDATPMIADAAPPPVDASRRPSRRKDAGRVTTPRRVPPWRDAGAGTRPRQPDAAPRRVADAGAAEFGRITVPPVEPFVNVSIDGESFGASPLFKRRVRAGIRQVTFINPADNSVISTRRVTVKANQIVTVRAPSIGSPR